ncbi:hypothetical protein B296_00053596 [Ensete ventricosum]|uniref:Uncharacterized protein n=1 Tax=Ensete ventricosum TaxID=4639 RepID=A0A426WVJ6_ENSVE|nr:hypothetical protein B296_00053596 [Ensete ventricosum]
MTTKHKSPTFRSSIHPRLSEVIGSRQSTKALSITPFTISGKESHCPTNTEVQKDMSNKFNLAYIGSTCGTINHTCT